MTPSTPTASRSLLTPARRLPAPATRLGLAATATILSAWLAACSPGDAEVTLETPNTPSVPQTSAGAPPAAGPGSGAAVAPAGTPNSIAADLYAPWSIAFHAGSALISERDTGRILELPARGGDDAEPRLVDTIDGVAPLGEGGLLGLAVHGAHLYVYSTATDENRIERYRIEGQPGSLQLGDGETILDGLPSAGYHNGGRIAFGPDGMLYASVGDAGRSSDAQETESLGGKILRMTPQGAVPEDNPFPGSLVYSYGHRNVQGLAWAADGTFFATEFGQDTWDELNIIEPGGNYGWPEVEGIAGEADFIDPVQQWSPEEASPSGMAAIDGTLVIANLRGESLRLVPTDDPASSTVYYQGEYGRIRDAVRAPGGDLWFLTNNTDGRGSPQAGDDHLMSVALTP